MTEEDARRYIETHLLAQSPNRLPPFAIEPAYRIERLTKGTNHNIYKLMSPGSAPFVMRLLKNDEMTEQHFGFGHYLAERGFIVPEIVYEDRSKETLRKYGCAVCVESFIEGDHFEGNHRGDLSVIHALAELMARLHAVTSDEAGVPWRPESRPGFDLLMDRVGHFYERAIKTGLIGKKEARAHQEWFGRWREPLVAARPYNLVHGDLNWSNVIVRPDGGIGVLDFMITHFGHFELDLAESARTLFLEETESWELFSRRYFELAGEAMRERYERNKLFFLAYVNLKKAASNAGKAAKAAQGRKTADKSYEEKSHRCLAALRAMIDQ